MSIGCKQYVGERIDPDSTSKVMSYLLGDAYLFEFQRDCGVLKFGGVGQGRLFWPLHLLLSENQTHDNVLRSTMTLTSSKVRLGP